jgi:hypothetical protein
VHASLVSLNVSEWAYVSLHEVAGSSKFQRSRDWVVEVSGGSPHYLRVQVAHTEVGHFIWRGRPCCFELVLSWSCDLVGFQNECVVSVQGRCGSGIAGYRVRNGCVGVYIECRVVRSGSWQAHSSM